MNNALEYRATACLDLYVPAVSRFGLDLSFVEYLDANDFEAVAHLDDAQRLRLLDQRMKRRPLPIIDEDGELILAVPLDNAGRSFAYVDIEDWIEMQEAGYNALWSINGGSVKLWRPMAGKCGIANMVTVARLILDLGTGERARFLNGVSLDLRRSNLAYVRRPRAGSGAGVYSARAICDIGIRLKAAIVANQAMDDLEW